MAFIVSALILVLLTVIAALVSWALLRSRTEKDAFSPSEDPGTRKKYPWAELRNYSMVFGALGLLIAVSFAGVLIEFPTMIPAPAPAPPEILYEDEEIQDIPITEPPAPVPPPPIVAPTFEEKEDDLVKEDPPLNLDPDNMIAPPPPPPPPSGGGAPVNDDPVLVSEIKPEFPGDVNRYVTDNFQVDSKSANEGKGGKIMVSFVIEKDGSVSNAQVMRGINPRLDAEALRVVNKMPKWSPAKNQGKPVRYRFVLPIRLKFD